jgi:hypothetical protein
MKTLAQLFFAVAFAACICGCSSSSKPVAMPGVGDGSAEKKGPVTMPSASVETGDGPAEKDLARVLDIPLYPGSKVVKNKVAKAGEETRYHLTLETSDPVQKVADFFQSIGIPSMVHAGMGQAIGSTKNGNDILVDMTRKGEMTQIAIRVSTGGKHA